jgi:hypothetical protein
MKKTILLLSAFLLIEFLNSFSVSIGQTPLPSGLWKHAGDYTFMYFPKPLESAKEFHIQTNHHFMAFNFTNLEITDLRIIADAFPEMQAVRRNLDFLPLVSPSNLLSIHFIRDGISYKMNRGIQTLRDCQLVESGKFFQRRFLKNLGFESGSPAAEANIELSSWPDRLSILLEVKPGSPGETDKLELNFIIPEAIRHSISVETNRLLAHDENGNGFLFYVTGEENLTVIDGHTLEISQENPENQSYRIELIILPVKGYAGQSLDILLANEKGSIEINANQLTPLRAAISTGFDPVHGWYNVFLRNDGSGNERIERVKIELTNPDDKERTVRLNFNKTTSTGVFGVTGISAMIRDNNLNPTGIPIQLSKNWHINDEGDLFMGPWFRGFTMIQLPANTAVEFEFTLVNAMWGKLPAASHNQLSLIGWSMAPYGNQLWEQAAIGAWGETICFSPDGGLGQSMVCDFRPLMIQSLDPALGPNKWNWTFNVGGADFFRFYNPSGQRQFITRLKTHHKRVCPNLTEVTYAGVTQGEEADYELTASIFRSDDYVRVVYKMRLEVHEQIDFSRLAILQSGTDTYSSTSEKKLAFGDENGLIEEWDAQWGGSVYRKTGLSTEGDTPWISMHEGVIRDPSSWGAWANRGIVVKKWDALIGGEVTDPYFSEYGTISRGVATSLLEVNPPPGITSLVPGDYIEAEIVQVILPQEEESYYGPNHNFILELLNNGNTWEPVYREATGNNLKVTANKGSVLHTFPVVVQVDANDEAEIEIVGGLGFMPVTFTGLSCYTGFSPKITGNGRNINMSDQKVHGNDYWQTDYDPVTETWEITYSVPLDSIYGFTAEQSSIILYNDFDETQLYPWSHPLRLTFVDKVDNPAPSEVNPNARVAKVIKGEGVHSAVSFKLPDYLDLTTNNIFRLKVYYEGEEPLPSLCNIRMYLRKDGTSLNQYSVIQNIKKANAWDEYVFNFSGTEFKSNYYNEVSLFFSTPDSDGIATGQVFYIDDLKGPPLSISQHQLDLHTTTGGDTIVIDFARSGRAIGELMHPIFALHTAGSKLIKNDSISSDSLCIYLHINEDMIPDGRDTLLLSYISGKIYNAAGAELPHFRKKAVVNNIPLSDYHVNFTILNANTHAPLRDAYVKSDTTSSLTNSMGETVLRLPPGISPVIISKQDYFSIDTALNLSTDTSLVFHLRPSKAWVQFMITDGNSPIYNVNVNLAGSIRQTNTQGMATFTGLAVDSLYGFYAIMTGYDTLTGSLYLSRDTVINLVMDYLLTLEKSPEHYTLFPNPFLESLHVELSESTERIAIMNITGTVLKEFRELRVGYNTFVLDDIPPGIYVLLVKQSDKNRFIKIVKQ